jgi:adenosylmethionine-8-amino-7-oxononanoate aminotransferase
MFASERFALDPDVMLLAKGITSGYLPLGAMVVAERLWSPFWDNGGEIVFRHGLTYAGHASVCAAAMANLDILERERLAERVRSLEVVLDEVLHPLAGHDLVKEVRSGVGLLAGVQLVDVGAADRVASRCIENGVLIRVITEGTLQISPPFVVTEDDLGLLAEVLHGALDSVAASL